MEKTLEIMKQAEFVNSTRVKAQFAGFGKAFNEMNDFIYNKNEVIGQKQE